MRLPLPNKLQRDTGLMLVECLMYISAVMVIVGLALAIFYQCQTQSVRLSRQSEHIAITLRFGERWRKEVRNAPATPEIKEHDSATAFHIPAPKGEIVYLYDGAAVWRKAAKDSHYVLFVEGIAGLKFQKEVREHAAGWRMEIELATYERHPKNKPQFSFLCVNPG